jgi:hypothetical protein
MTKKIKNLRSNNSKEFWKLMRKGTYRKQPNISIDTLYDFFKTLNQNQTNFKIEKFSEKAFNLVSNTAVNNLPKQLKIVIGRTFFGSK